MYMRAFPMAYHQKFISHGKIFDQMNKEEITQFFQILHREEEKRNPKAPQRQRVTSKELKSMPQARIVRTTIRE